MSASRMIKVDEFETYFELEIKAFADRLNVRVKGKDISTLPFKKVRDNGTICWYRGKKWERRTHGMTEIKDWIFGMLMGDNI